jgi:cytoskeletal protein CcmA (bactofilin family)
MGATYTRQSSYTDGDVIQAADTNNEFDQLLAAFASSTGHTHDGTTAEGGPITKLLGTAITIGDGTAGTDIAVTFDGETADGVLTWKEDEDYFEFSDDILIASTEKLQFRDTAIYINSSADGQLDLVADTEIQIAATTVDINGNADISGNLGIGGNLTVTGTTTFNGGTLTLGDANTDNIVFGGEVDSSIVPDDDDTFDLGSSSKEWRDLYIDGVAYLDAINFNGTAITSTAAELNILDGVTATATELNALDGITSTVTELNIIDGDTSATSTTVADADRVVLNDSGTMKQVAVTDLSAYFDDEITAMPNLVTTAATTVGALNSGSITSGFGTIDTGSSTITTTGLITGGSLDIDDVVINGTNIGHTDDTDLITVANGALTVAGNLTVSGNFTLGSGAELSESELEQLDGITQGNVSASKAVVTNSDKDITGFRNVTLTGELDAGSLDVSGDADIDGTLEADAITVNGTALSSVIAGTTVSNATLAATVTVADSASNADFPVVFHNESNSLLDDTGALKYNPSTGTLSVPNLSVAGTTTTVNTVTMNAENAIVFEGATADAHETTLTIIDPTADRTINLPNVSGTIPVLAAVSTTQISSTPAELNLVDGSSAGTIVNSKAVIYGSSGEVNATTLQIAGTSITSTAAELNILDGVTSTATELNIMDGDTSASSTTLADADRVVTNDNGTMKQVALTDVKTYLSSAGFTTDDPTALAIALG